ncbi:MAG: SDR family oxidoreductase [Candidatus Omnitrophica bacterium]|nr:Dihydroanticapsin 7-dehydrogenase [bacterium]NUN95614.1 SDR family oxidoreductase [Candidatus Omnitrophota bacterium]
MGAFESKAVVVTGGAQGIGLAISVAFGEEGANVIVVDIDSEAGEEAVERLRSQGGPATFVQADVAHEVDVLRLRDQALEVGGRVDVLVNNAGIGSFIPLQEQTLELWDRVLNINLRGPWLCAKYLSPHISEGGAIVNISSTRALMSEPNTEPYSASKGGILGLTHSLAMTLAAKRIRVNCISPGWIATSEWRKHSNRKPFEGREIDHSQHPVGRVGVPEDIARACLFLADTTQSGFLTGQNLVIDGGMTVKMIYVE